MIADDARSLKPLLARFWITSLATTRWPPKFSCENSEISAAVAVALAASIAATTAA